MIIAMLLHEKTIVRTTNHKESISVGKPNHCAREQVLIVLRLFQVNIQPRSTNFVAVVSLRIDIFIRFLYILQRKWFMSN